MAAWCCRTFSLTGSSFEKAELFRADFAGSNLTNADLNKTELGRANFNDSNLTGAQITFTNLARANFKDLHHGRHGSEPVLDLSDPV